MKPTPRKRGTTLVEMMCYIALMLLVVTGATMALIGTLRGSARLSSRSDQVRESARMVRRLSNDLNDAAFAILPTDSSSKRSWPLLAGNSNLFISNIQGNSGNGNSGNGSNNSGPGNNNGNSSNSSDTSLSTAVIATIPGHYDLTLRDSGGGAFPLTGSSAPLSRTSVAGGVLIYRGKANGNPDSKNGTYLWMKLLSADRQFSAPVMLSDQVSSAKNAVSFTIDKDGLVGAEVALQDAALGSDEANPIAFTLELTNYTSTAGAQASAFLGGS
ncbi:MAG: hypothetical protein QM758_10540 [Armatimonas sp.]